jgi:membrane protein
MQKRVIEWKERSFHFYRYVDRKLFGVPSIIFDSIQHFIRSRGPEAAASMAYYVIFSLFPLLLAIIAIAGFFLESTRVQVQVLNLVELILPVGRSLVVDIIQEVLDARGASGLIGAIGLVWAASGAFNTLFRNVNRAWRRAEPLSALKGRLFAMTMIILLVFLMVLIRYLSAMINLLPQLSHLLGENGALYDSFLWILISNLIPLVLTFLIFLAIYRWIPNTKVRWSEAFWGALLVALALELTTVIFSWFLGTGLVQYQLVYGSLGALIALMFWIYLNSMVIFYGAHLTAAIARSRRPEGPAVKPIKEAGEAARWQ